MELAREELRLWVPLSLRAGLARAAILNGEAPTLVETEAPARGVVKWLFVFYFWGSRHWCAHGDSPSMLLGLFTRQCFSAPKAAPHVKELSAPMRSCIDTI